MRSDPCSIQGAFHTTQNQPKPNPTVQYTAKLLSEFLDNITWKSDNQMTNFILVTIFFFFLNIIVFVSTCSDLFNFIEKRRLKLQENELRWSHIELRLLNLYRYSVFSFSDELIDWLWTFYVYTSTMCGGLHNCLPCLNQYTLEQCLK